MTWFFLSISVLLRFPLDLSASNPGWWFDLLFLIYVLLVLLNPRIVFGYSVYDWWFGLEMDWEVNGIYLPYDADTDIFCAKDLLFRFGIITLVTSELGISLRL